MTARVWFMFLNLATLSLAFETQIIDANLEVLQSQNVNSTVQLIFHFRSVQDSGLRVYSFSAKAEQEQPVIFTVRQEKGSFNCNFSPKFHEIVVCSTFTSQFFQE